MQPTIRKIITYDEEVLIEGYRATTQPWRMFAVAAVVENPWAGRYVADLKPEIHAYGPVLGALLTAAGAACYIELASTYPEEGGDYHFLKLAYGSSS